MTLKLLVADDSITIQKIVALAFGGEDAVIQSVSNGDSAYDEAKAFKPDIVLADVFMPGCTGYEVCRHIKEDPDLQSTPVILLVGAFEPFDESEAVRVKCNAHLTKPFDTTELIQMVRKLINKDDAAQSHADVREGQEMNQASNKSAVSSAARSSFLGSDRILDLFDPEIISDAGRKSVQQIQFAIPKSEDCSKNSLSEDAIELIVNRVIRRMSSDVVREVAWEVVPELSEVIIRRTIEEQKKV